MAALAPVVVMVSVDMFPLVVGVTDPGEKLLALQAGRGEPVPVTAQPNVTELL